MSPMNRRTLLAQGGAAALAGMSLRAARTGD